MNEYKSRREPDNDYTELQVRNSVALDLFSIKIMQVV